ncbi:MAG TPA: PQQ-binding-like beta-propeller repeat protein [Phycisphaerae bacterium]|nr:PQQ-binding-like beta-propeller repeat protein [Phycisphaerae bacterium]
MCTRVAIASALLSATLLATPTFADPPKTISLSNATIITLPSVSEGNVASFTTPDGHSGWVRKLSNDAIPTPAFANGKIFTGAGMTTANFLALDAATGNILWQKPTTDSGPTSPVIQGRFVAYNTESCDTETRDEDSGELVWHETTGGSLLTQPVIAPAPDNMLIIPHPTMQRKAQMSDDSFKMLSVDLQTGKHHWEADMTADVLAAPVASNGRVFFTCTDGRLFCITTNYGGSGWHILAHATSAPVVVGDVLAVTTEEPRTFGGATVSVRRYNTATGESLDDKPLAPTTVGKAFLAPHQRAEWDYQGPKIAANGQTKTLFVAPGNTINAIDLDSGKTLWHTTISAWGLSNAANSLTPPALGKTNLYLGTARGQLLALKQSDASLAFAYNLSQPLASQPILADGNLYLGTTNGYLICLKLNNPDASNWTAWGGDAQHNKVE